MNKIRFDRFSAAVDKCFEDSNKGGQVRWTELKEDIFIGMSDWYRRTHAGLQFLCALLHYYSSRKYVCMKACLLVMIFLFHNVGSVS